MTVTFLVLLHVTGEKVTSGYQNWDSGQPSCWLPEFMCTEDCAVLRLDEGYKWHDYFCAATRFEYAFICQYGKFMVKVLRISREFKLFTEY